MTPEEMALWYSMDTTKAQARTDGTFAIPGVTGSTIFDAAVYAEKRIMSDHPADDLRYWVGRLDQCTSLLASVSIWDPQTWLETVRHVVRSETVDD